MSFFLSHGALLLWICLIIYAVCGITVVFLYHRSKQLSRKTLAIPGGRNSEESPKAELIKKKYRFLLKAMGIAYFLFLPLPFFTIFFVVVFLNWLLLSWGLLSVPALAGISIFFILFTVLFFKSILIPRSHCNEDFLIPEKDAPDLYALCRSVTQALEIQPFDFIYFDPGEMIRVVETGTFLTHFAGRNKRCLFIGLGVLEDLSVVDLQAIFAHEAAHLKKNDTREDPLFLFAESSLEKAFSLMVQKKMNSRFHIFWLYIKLFRKIMRTAASGASRCRESAADDLAARLVGSAPLGQALLKVLKAQSLFAVNHKIALMHALNRGEAPENIYTFKPDGQWPEDVRYSYGFTFMTCGPSSGLMTPEEYAQASFEDELNRETGPADSHPAVKDRLALLAQRAYSKGVLRKFYRESIDQILPKREEYQKICSRILYEDLLREKEILTEEEYRRVQQKRA